MQFPYCASSTCDIIRNTVMLVKVVQCPDTEHLHKSILNLGQHKVFFLGIIIVVF